MTMTIRADEANFPYGLTIKAEGETQEGKFAISEGFGSYYAQSHNTRTGCTPSGKRRCR